MGASLENATLKVFSWQLVMVVLKNEMAFTTSSWCWDSGTRDWKKNGMKSLTIWFSS